MTARLSSALRARPAIPSDAEAVAALILAADRAHVVEPDATTADDVLAEWRHIDLGQDALVVQERAGGLVAYGALEHRGEAVVLDGFVEPPHTRRGLGAFLVDWAEEQARERGTPVVRATVLAADAAATELFRARGYGPVRSFSRMLIDFESPPPVECPDGLELESLRPGDARTLHEVIEEAFAEHWGHRRRSFEDWRESVLSTPGFDPSLCLLARQRGEPVGGAICERERFGFGWVGMLAVRPAWRRQGLGRALLWRSFAELYGRGCSRVGLAVDSANATGATSLYEQSGMRIAWRADVYERRLSNARLPA